MENTFIDALNTELDGTPVVDDGNVAYTENGALAYRTTNSAVLDYFSNGGALRSRSDSDVIEVFKRAFQEDALLATKALFYFRDIRGGQGERHTFRTILKWLAETHPSVVRANLQLISEYGRWDDLYTLVGTDLEDSAFDIFSAQLESDNTSEQPSLLAKWLKSENTSSKVSKKLARKTRIALDMSPRTYRKMLTRLRKQIGLVEQRISDGEWGGIEYDKIPSKAGLQYRKAFRRHDEERYQAFLDAVKIGAKKMNAGTLYPYEIVQKIEGRRYYGCYGSDGDGQSDADTLDAMWNSLPNYFEGNEGVRGLVVADVSGSMYGLPMDVSVSLAIYTAERNTGPFAGQYMTFTSHPKLIKVKKGSIVEKVQQIESTDVGYNTNIEAVFMTILRAAKRQGLSQDDLPTHLYIVSDMEFDDRSVGAGIDERLFQSIKRTFEADGYKMPFLVYWNVDSRNDQQPMTMDDRGFQMVSGCSPSIFTSLLKNKAVSAYELMLEVLNDARYAPIGIE